MLGVGGHYACLISFYFPFYFFSFLSFLFFFPLVFFLLSSSCISLHPHSLVYPHSLLRIAVCPHPFTTHQEHHG